MNNNPIVSLNEEPASSPPAVVHNRIFKLTDMNGNTLPDYEITQLRNPTKKDLDHFNQLIRLRFVNTVKLDILRYRKNDTAVFSPPQIDSYDVWIKAADCRIFVYDTDNNAQEVNIQKLGKLLTRLLVLNTTHIVKISELRNAILHECLL